MPLPPGAFAASVTPFTPGGLQLDLDWIPRHLAYLEQRGADGVLALGTNGEGPSLSLDERRRVVDTVLAHKRKLWVYIGTGCASLTDTIEISRYAHEAGADGLMIVPPFYYKRVDDEGLIAYYDAVLKALPGGARVLLYNIPAMSGVEITDGLLDYLTGRYPRQVVGIKDTSGSLQRLKRYVTRYPGLAVYCGSDGLVARGFRAGAVGAISAVANVFPEHVRAAREASLSGERGEGEQAAIDGVRGLLGRYPPQSAIKHALRIVGGLPQAHVRPPLRDLTPAEAAGLERELAALATS